ncbi:MAG TPA: AAA family ATPase [Pirellulaceae bacterium]|nr:AAA family ATPase [Pirellulaceae bacterium]
MSHETFLRRVKIRHYKSIGHCAVDLGPVTMLVGRNGSGKSNFLDALRFIADGLQTSLDHAIKSRGGIDEVRRRSTGHPHNFAIELSFDVDEWNVATYAFEIGSIRKGGFTVKHESLKVVKPNGEALASYIVEEGGVQASLATMPPAATDRLYLVSASGLPQFRPVYDALLSMGFYNLNPAQMKEFQSPDAGELLRRDGSNIASVIARLTDQRPEIKDRIKEYLRTIVPDIVDFSRVSFAHRETLEFKQDVKGSEHPWRFNAASMSDGTLRALGVLVATTQLVDPSHNVRLVGIEEPETALHPAAAAALMDSLREASAHTQVLVTTHSPDMLDRFDADTDVLLAVVSNQGTTEIGPVDSASRETLKSQLYTAGELLRMDQLQPDPESVPLQIEFAFDANGVGT